MATAYSWWSAVLYLSQLIEGIKNDYFYLDQYYIAYCLSSSSYFDSVKLPECATQAEVMAICTLCIDYWSTSGQKMQRKVSQTIL